MKPLTRSSLLRLGLMTAALLLPTSVWSYPLTVNDAQGRVTLDAAPQRIAVFDLAVLDTLAALDVPVAGVPGAPWPAHMTHYASAEHTPVGTLFAPDEQALAALKPDLIIVAGRSRNARDKLATLAPTLDLTVASDAFLADTRRNLALLGEVFGRQQQASALAERLSQTLTALHQHSAKAGSAVVLFTVNNNVMLHAPGDRFGMLYDVLGLPAAGAPFASLPEGPRPQAGSPEAAALKALQHQRLTQALAANPDWLIVLDRSAATGGEPAAADTLGAHPVISASDAWREGKVFYLDPPTWYVATGGYEGLLNTLEMFREKLAP